MVAKQWRNCVGGHQARHRMWPSPPVVFTQISLMAARNAMLALLISMQMLISSVAVSAPAALPSLERVTVMAATKMIADFELTDQNGKPRAWS